MKNILIPTDLTACTRSTLKYAIKFSSVSNTKLFFYHISEKSGSVITAFLKEYIGKVFAEKNLDIDQMQTEFIAETGEFSNQLIKRIIKRYSIDLVIMGASHEAFRNTFFGSYVSDLINDISCPVLSIPHGIYNGFSMERIGFASELFDLKKRIKAIIPFAKLFGSAIEIFHVYPVYPQQVDIHKYNTDKILDQIRSENNYDKISIHFIKTPFDNEPVKGIMNYIKSNHPDLIVMSHKPRGLFDKLALDSGVTAALVRSSPIPILALNKKTTAKLL